MENYKYKYIIAMMQEHLGGTKGTAITFITFFLGNILSEVQLALSIVSFAIAIIVGLFTLIEKINSYNKK
jgi:hypothetical protein